MLVSEYVLQIIEKRPYKYSTKLTNVADVKRLGIWDMDTSEIHSGMIHERVDKVANQNSRKRLYITARSMFKDLGICQDLPYLEGEGKIYDIPSQEDLEWLIARSKYRLQLLLCMYGGLRVGEACAVTPEKLQNNYLDVNQAFSQDGLHLGMPRNVKSGPYILPMLVIIELHNTYFLCLP
jgi:integrase